EEVRCLDIAMHDARRVGMSQRLTCLDDAVGDLEERKPLRAELRAEVLPVEPLHHHEGDLLERSYRPHPDDVLARQAGCETRFPKEALCIRAFVRPQDLDRDLLALRLIPRRK